MDNDAIFWKEKSMQLAAKLRRVDELLKTSFDLCVGGAELAAGQEEVHGMMAYLRNELAKFEIPATADLVSCAVMFDLGTGIAVMRIPGACWYATRNGVEIWYAGRWNRVSGSLDGDYLYSSLEKLIGELEAERKRLKDSA